MERERRDEKGEGRERERKGRGGGREDATHILSDFLTTPMIRRTLYSSYHLNEAEAWAAIFRRCPWKKRRRAVFTATFDVEHGRWRRCKRGFDASSQPTSAIVRSDCVLRRTSSEKLRRSAGWVHDAPTPFVPLLRCTEERPPTVKCALKTLYSQRATLTIIEKYRGIYATINFIRLSVITEVGALH